MCVRFSNRELDPLWGAGLRFALAAALLAAAMALLRIGIPRRRALTGTLLFGVFNFGASYALMYYGLVRVHAGLGQTVLALVPLAALLLAVLQGQEKFRRAAVVGALLALCGIAVMSRGPFQDGVPLLSLLALIAAAVCFAQAAVMVRHFPPVHPVAINAVAMATGAALLLAGSLAAGEQWAVPSRAATVAAVAYLVVFGSVVVFLLYLFVLGRWSASRTAYGFVLAPVVTIGLSAWLDDEPLRLGLIAGALLVIAGVYIGALRSGDVAPAAEP